MEFCRQKYWSGLPFPFPRDLPHAGIEPRTLALQADSLPYEPKGEICHYWRSQRQCIFLDFFCDLLVIQQCVVQPPYVGIFNSFSPVIEIYSYCIVVRKDAWNYVYFFEFTKASFMAQDVIYPGEGSMCA